MSRVALITGGAQGLGEAGPQRGSIGGEYLGQCEGLRVVLCEGRP